MFSRVGERHPAVVCGSRLFSPLEAVTSYSTVSVGTCVCVLHTQSDKCRVNLIDFLPTGCYS